ncbi:hypothetical protein ABZ905_36985 [Streptomyces parvus]|uniref:hypothetical protein n=1 Tax=Streptomyces parvus TaxID=66428 RepID=UPI0033DAF551
MAAKLKVQDVLAAGSTVGLVGSGKTPHVLKSADSAKALCNGKDAKPSSTLEGELPVCANCAKLFNVNTENNEENDTMAKTASPADKAKADETYEQVRTDVMGVVDAIGKLNKGDAEKIKGLQKQADDELLKVSGSHRATLRMLVTAAATAANDRPAGTTTTAVAVHKQTKEMEEIEGYAEIIDQTSDIVAEGFKAEEAAQATAGKVANALLEARLRTYNAKGDPDINGRAVPYRNLAGTTYRKAADKLLAGGYDNKTADYEDLREGLENKVSYQFTALLPELFRAMDTDAERAEELFPRFVGMAKKENVPVSEVLFREYKVNPLSAAERQAEKRRLAALEKAKAKELTDGTANTEATEGGSGESGGEGGEAAGSPEASEYSKQSVALGSVAEVLTGVLENAEKYDDDQREALRKQITGIMAKLGETLTALS